jgi:hypothetical protein
MYCTCFNVFPFQAKRDELLQFAQDAVSGLKRNTEITRFSLSLGKGLKALLVLCLYVHIYLLSNLYFLNSG